MDLVDRLLSAAGGVADAADRFAGLFQRRSSARRRQPGGLMVAAGLGVLALLFLLVGAESMDGPDPRPIGAGVGDDPAFGDHSFVTVRGQVASTFGGHFFDLDGDGVQDVGETSSDWVYVVEDPGTHRGVTVVSSRDPSEVYRTTRTGVVVDDPSYIAEDLPYISDDIGDLDLVLDHSRYIDARRGTVGDPTTFDFGTGLPPAGTSMQVDGGVVATWTYTCPSDADCDQAGAESFDLLLYDPASRRAIVVVTDTDPMWSPATFSGMLRREEHGVSEALDPQTFDLDAMGVSVSSRYLLEDGAAPVSPAIAWWLAVLCALVGTAIVIGLAAGFLIYRRSAGPLPVPARTMAVDERIPVRVTGWLRAAGGTVRVREAPADLVRFATTVPAGSPRALVPPQPPDVPDVPEVREAPSTLIIERRDRPEGVPLGRGAVSGLSTGVVVPLRGARPAIRIRTSEGPLLVSFDSVAERDRAAAEVLDEAAAGRQDAATDDAAPTDGAATTSLEGS